MICILENKEINKEHFDCVFENSLKDKGIIYLVYRDEKIEEIAKDKQFEQIELSTSIYRKDAHRFYERQGYEKLHYNYTKALDD